MSENTKSFRELYNEIWKPKHQAQNAAQEFISRCAAATLKSEGTVRSWLSGKFVPDDLTRMALAKELGVDPDTLFPEKPKKKEAPISKVVNGKQE